MTEPCPVRFRNGNEAARSSVQDRSQKLEVMTFLKKLQKIGFYAGTPNSGRELPIMCHSRHSVDLAWLGLLGFGNSGTWVLISLEERKDDVKVVWIFEDACVLG